MSVPHDASGQKGQSGQSAFICWTCHKITARLEPIEGFKAKIYPYYSLPLQTLPESFCLV